MIQLGLAGRRKKFSLSGFGTGQKAENLTTVPPAGDDTSIKIRREHSDSWPTPFDFNFMTRPFRRHGNAILYIRASLEKKKKYRRDTSI